MKTSIQNETTKVYVVLFSCCSSRAVHLERVPNMTTDSFICSLRRFCSRRGVPNIFLSDNAKQFKQTDNVLTFLFKQAEVQQFLTKRNIHWRFNLEKSPWQGGFYERMVRTVKRSLRTVLESARVSYEELQTLLTETECTINSLPLTFVSSEDVEEPLTPSHLICGCRLGNLPDVNAELDPYEDYVENSSAEVLSRGMKYMMFLLTHFWKRFTTEYLNELREHHKANSRTETVEIAVRDVVVVKNENLPRSRWSLGRVTELIKSGDNEIRGAIVKVSTHSRGRSSTLKRPIQHLYPVEVSGRNTENLTTKIVDEPATCENQSVKRTSPRRMAAINADIIRRLNDEGL